MRKGSMETIRAISKERWRATADERRCYGGKTVTEFWVIMSKDGVEEKMLVVKGYGATPGERKTFAIESAKKQWGLT